MKGSTDHWMTLKAVMITALAGGLFLWSGCGKPGDVARNYTNCMVTVVSINENTPLQSDVVRRGFPQDDFVTIELASQFRAPADDPTAPDGPSLFDTIRFYQYLVNYFRSDGGVNPASFSAGMNLIVEPNSTGSAEIVLVPAFHKNRAPLQQLRDDGEIFTTAVITFYGTDGNGNDVAVDGYLTVLFANFLDQ